MKSKLLLTCSLLFSIQAATVPAQTPGSPKGNSVVAGKVRLRGEPARGVTIALFDKSVIERNPNSPGLRAKSQPDGTFLFRDVPAGIYFLTVFAPGYVAPGDANFWPVGRSKIVNVAEGETIDDLDLELQPGGVITGKVTDSGGRPVVDAHVDLMNLDENGRRIPVRSGWNPFVYLTDDRGIYRIYGLPAGKYVASIGFENKPGSITFTNSRSYYPKTWHPDATELEKARVLELKEGDEITGVDIVVGGIKRTFDVLGRVVDDETGRPLAGIQVSYGQYDSKMNQVTAWGSEGGRTDAGGGFRLSGVLPGSYAAFIQPSRSSEFFSDATPFTISDADVEGLELRATRGLTASGRVVPEGPVDPSRGAVPGQLKVYASAARDEAGVPGTAIDSDVLPDMTFRLKGLRPGKHLIGAVTTNNETKIAVTRVEKDGAVAPDNRIEIAAGEQIRNLTVYFTLATGVIRGQVRVIGGAVPSGLIVGAWAKKDGQSFGNNSVEADSRGNFVFQYLAPGDYEINLTCRPAERGDPSPEIRYIMEKVSGVRERVRIGYGSEANVTMTVDLTAR
ncbi:MAG: hypothetical protein IPM66_13250 [Acidobacteriota bacterium]|nr:MAG: hypothetical protein IPM66_13250 [Acidobacteriota bacterium]